MALPDIAGIAKIPVPQFAIDSTAYLRYITTTGFKMVPKNGNGINGFVFDYEGETNLALQAEITDHFAEDNTAIQDHIALKPLRLTLHGFQAEVSFNRQLGILGFLSALQEKLTVVPAYLGKLTPGGLAKAQQAISQAQNIAIQINQAVARIKNIVGLFSKALPTPNRQQKAYINLAGLMLNKQLFSVGTPYGLIDNMVIESLSFTQPEDTKFWTDISVTLKQMRFAETASVQISASSRAAAQRAFAKQQGPTQGASASSALSILTGVAK